MSKFHPLRQFKTKKLFKKQDIEPQEVFLDELAKKKEKEISPVERKIEVPLSRRILQGFLFFSFIIFIFLLVKTFQFQVLENKKFSALAKENKFIINHIKADRGVIYDRNKEQIVFNKSSFNLILNKDELPYLIKQKEKILSEVSGIIEEDINVFKKKIEQEEGNPIIVLKNLDHEKLIILETRMSDLTGFKIKKNTIREYKDGKTFAHIIGYTGIVSKEELLENPENYSSFDYTGKTGIEKSYEEILRKNPGKLQIERDVQGNELSREIIALPQSGNSLILHLDINLQKKIEEELINTIKRVGAKKAVGVALDPKNGGVLALVSLPSFDNNTFSKDSGLEEIENILKNKNEPLFNRVISGRYVIGSTIKPLVAAAALEEKIISASKIINCTGKISIPHRYDPEIIYERKDWNIHGLTDMRKAIAESCNVYFYTIGGGYEGQVGLGPSKIKKYLELFGWGDKTGIDLLGEEKGFIPYPEWKKEVKKEGWWDGDTYNLSIGQGDIMITPLQVAFSFAAVANRGVLYKPKIVKEIIDSEKNIIERINPELIRKDFIDIENLEIVRQGMRRAVTGYNAPNASSVLLNSLPVSCAAKTGTAQTPIKDHYHNWITVFAPYENPEIVLTIMIEKVPEVQAATLPIAKGILEYYFTK